MSELGHRGEGMRVASDRHIADRILMKLPPFSDSWNEEVTFGIVEGRNDVHFYSSFFRGKNMEGLDHCVLEEALGKDEVKSAVRELRKEFSIRGIKNLCFGLIDADFEGDPPPGDFFITDTHDIETLSVKSEAFEVFVEHSIDSEKLRQFLISNEWPVEEGASGLRGYLCSCATDLGRLRWVSLNKRYHLRFKVLRPLDDYLDLSNLKFKVKEVVNFFKSFEPWKLADRNILKDVEDKNWDRLGKWLVVQGHDLCFVLAVGLDQFGAPQNMEESDYEEVIKLASEMRVGDYSFESIALQVERALRSIFSQDHFKKTKLYKEIVSWQDEKIQLKELREPILN